MLNGPFEVIANIPTPSFAQWRDSEVGGCFGYLTARARPQTAAPHPGPWMPWGPPRSPQRQVSVWALQVPFSFWPKITLLSIWALVPPSTQTCDFLPLSQHFTNQREEFEGTRESILVWLTEMDLQLTNVEHFSESDADDKMRQLNVRPASLATLQRFHLCRRQLAKYKFQLMP